VASDLGAAAVVYEQFALCSLGCGWLGRAVLQLELELERWCVGTAVPEGGIGVPGGGPEGCASKNCVVWATRFARCWLLASYGAALLEG
jgi:hypothetical protein